MRVIIQRVQFAKLSIESKLHAEIGKGFLVLAGFEDADDQQDIEWISNKILALRVFGDESGRMNCSLNDIEGAVLGVSQFTLHASTKKGARPSFLKAAKPSKAEELYNSWKLKMKTLLADKFSSGVFGADMQIELLNDGPVTISIDSKNKE